MNIRTYATADGHEIDLERLEASEGEQVVWLARDALSAPSWTAFKDASGWRVATHAKERVGNAWQQHDLYRLHLDLLGQISIVSGEAMGQASTSFSGFLLDCYVDRYQARRGALLHLIHEAQARDQPFKSEDSDLHRFALHLVRLGIAPYPYPFEVTPPRRIFSGPLQGDVDALETAGLVQFVNPIKATAQGAALIERTAIRCPTLRQAVRHLLLQVKPPTVEMVFGQELDEYWKIAL